MTFELQKAIVDHLRFHELTKAYKVVDNAKVQMPFLHIGADFGTDQSNTSALVLQEFVQLDVFTDNDKGSIVVRQMCDNVVRAMRDFAPDLTDLGIHVLQKPRLELFRITLEENTNEKRMIQHGILQFRFDVQYLDPITKKQE